jgi:diguanylate cyclase (GGDEF)-like protein
MRPLATPRAPGTTAPRERSDRQRAFSGAVGRVAIVDADSTSASGVAELLTRDGHFVELSMDVRAIDAEAFDVVVIDDAGQDPASVIDIVRPPGRTGAAEVIILSSRNDVDAAVATLHRGASDFLVKPVSPQRLRLALGRALERRRLLRENARLQRDLVLMQSAQRLLEHLHPAELAIAGSDALMSSAEAEAVAVWSKDVRASRGLQSADVERIIGRDGPSGFVEHHTGDALGLPHLEVIMLVDLGADLRGAVGFAEAPTATQQESLFFMCRQLSTAFDNAARYQDAADLALRDPLTGLWNAAAFQTALEALVDESRKANRTFCVLFLDLDHFKQVNDRFGHLVGSRAIAAAAAATAGQVREGDVVARYGGDELVVLLPAVDADAGMIVAERIRAVVATVEVGEGVRLTVSIGLATFPHDGTDPQRLVDAADRGLYMAKGAQRNQVRRAPGGAAADVVVPLPKRPQ